MRSTRRLLIAVFIISMWMLFSCSANPADIIGTWQVTSGTDAGYATVETISFQEEAQGKVFTWTRVNASILEYERTGSWTVRDDMTDGMVSYRVQMEFEENGQSQSESLYYAPYAGGLLISDGSGKLLYQPVDDLTSESE